MKYPKYMEPEQLHYESDEVLERKVTAILAAMTDEEKLNLCHGHSTPDGMQVANAGYNPGIPRLGVPEIRMYDGPAGVTSVYETTGLPVQEMLAASWDTELAYEYGKVEGSEDFAISGNTQLGSQFDVVRVPQFDRVKDMLGEDPFLTTAMAVPETKGIQDAGAVATLKHFGVASIGTDMQDAADQLVDEQTLHEIVFPPFEAAAKEGRAGAFMCCYNKFNGSYASANEYAQKTVMRDMWGYKGYMMSDWGANHSLSTAKGMDMEMPSGTYNSNERILKGIAKGRLTWEDVDSAARHVLYGFGMAGYLSLVTLDENGNVEAEEGRTEPIRMKDRYTESVKAGLLNDNAEICLDIARKGTVLLKNEDKSLPLTETDYTGDNTVAMIGLGATHLLSGSGQERSYGRISRMKSPAQEVKRLTNGNIVAETGIGFFGQTIPAEYLYQDEAMTKPGLIRTYGVDETNCGMSDTIALMMAIMGMGKDDKPDKPPFPDGAAPEGIPPFPGDDMPDLSVLMGGGGTEFKGVASSDDEDDEPAPFAPNWTNSLAGDMEGYQTGDFCAVDDKIDFTVGTSDGKVNQNYKNAGDGTAFPKGSAYTWDGYLTAPVTGEYTLILQAIGGNTKFQIKLGDKYESVGSTELREGAQWPWGSLVATEEGMEIHGGTIGLEAGKAYPIRLMINASIAHKDLQVRLAWITPEQRKADYARAIAAAKGAKKVLFFLSEDYGFSPIGQSGLTFNMTGLPSMDVPAQQMALLRDVKAALSPDAKLIVLHNNGQLYALGEVEKMADALLNIWTPGQEGGQAVAEILLGRVNPSGKMALTIPARDEDTLVTDSEEHRKKRYASYINHEGKKVIDFDEGIFCGYRWYDKENIKPLYAFGHGLSYTTFAYSDIKVDGHYVAFTVTNTGDVTGSEIAQVYLGEAQVPEGVQMAKKQLCGFARIEALAPGESRNVTIAIPERSFCYWNTAQELVSRADGTKDKWVKAAGTRKVMVGPSSDILPLIAEITA